MWNAICQFHNFEELSKMTMLNKNWQKQIQDSRFDQLLIIHEVNDNMAKLYLKNARKIAFDGRKNWFGVFQHIQYLDLGYSSVPFFRQFTNLNTNHLIVLKADIEMKDLTTLCPSSTLRKLIFYVKDLDDEFCYQKITKIKDFLQRFPNLSCVHFTSADKITLNIPFFCRFTFCKYRTKVNAFSKDCVYCATN